MYQNYTQNYYKEYFVIFLISIICSWRVIRSIITSSIIWNIHYVLFISFFLFSVFLIFKKKRHNKIIFALVGLLALNINSLTLNGFFDSQFLFSVIILNCICLFIYVLENHNLDWIKIIDAVMMSIVVVQALCILDIFLSWRIIDYNYIQEKTGVPNIGARGATKLFMLFGIDNLMITRISGISGTPYASGGLVASIAAYFFAIKQYYKFLFSFIVLIFISSLSSIMALFFVLIFISKRMILPMLLFIAPIAYTIIIGYINIIASIPFVDVLKIFTELSYNGNHSSMIYLMTTIIGEGRLSGFVQSEFRLLNLFFSLGIFGSIIFLYIVFKLKYYSKVCTSKDFRFKGFPFFLITLIIANWHYHSFFVFPNIVFITLVIALIIVNYNKIITLEPK